MDKSGDSVDNFGLRLYTYCGRITTESVFMALLLDIFSIMKFIVRRFSPWQHVWTLCVICALIFIALLMVRWLYTPRPIPQEVIVEPENGGVPIHNWQQVYGPHDVQ